MWDFHSRSKDKDVVNIDDDASGPEDRVEQVCSDSLESGGGVAEAKVHDLRDETAKWGEECSAEAGPARNANVVESPMNIKFGEIMAEVRLMISWLMRGSGLMVRNCPLLISL